jgi:hypothetical protein
MIGRSPKTVANWAAAGKFEFVHLFGAPLVSLSMVESLIAGRVPAASPAADAALRMIGRRDRAGRRTEPERRRRSPRQRPMIRESGSADVLPSSGPPVGS